MYNHSHFMRWMSTKPMQKDLPKSLRFFLLNSIENFFIYLCDYCTSFLDSNVARLVGAITTDVYKSQAGGTRIFYIRTFNPDDF